MPRISRWSSAPVHRLVVEIHHLIRDQPLLLQRPVQWCHFWNRYRHQFRRWIGGKVLRNMRNWKHFWLMANIGKMSMTVKWQFVIIFWPPNTSKDRDFQWRGSDFPNNRRILMVLPVARQLMFASVFWRQTLLDMYGPRWKKYITSCVSSDIAAVSAFDDWWRSHGHPTRRYKIVSTPEQWLEFFGGYIVFGVFSTSTYALWRSQEGALYLCLLLLVVLLAYLAYT